MFTGLVADVGLVKQIEKLPDGVRLTVLTELAKELSKGDSIATNGVCLTVIEFDDEGFQAEVMNQSLRHTSLGSLEAESKVNLELPLAVGERLGGHIVQGHVDGLGEVSAVTSDGFSQRIKVLLSPDLLRYLVPKGSITVDGVSLTVSDLDQEGFEVSLIPETQTSTTLGQRLPGDRVNIEVDVLAKYIERLTLNPSKEK